MSTAPAPTRQHTPRSGRGGAWLALLLLALIALAANTGVSLWQGGQLADASGKAADLQVLSQQLANEGREAATGDAAAFAALANTRKAIAVDVGLLQQRYASDPAVSAQVARLAATWKPLNEQAAQLQSSQPAVLAMVGHAERFTARVPALQSQASELAQAMSTAGAGQAQLTPALQQLVLAGSMARRVTALRAADTRAGDGGNGLAADIAQFTEVLEALRDGNSALGIAAVRGSPAQAALAQTQQVWDQMRTDADALLASARSLSAARVAASTLTAGAAAMLADSRALFKAITTVGSAADTRVFPNFWLGVVSGALALFALVGYVVSTVRSRSREQELRYQTQVEYNSRNQQAIMRLLDEISSLGEGDLTVKASVTEEMTGAIADAINYAVDELRHLVTTINGTSSKVALATQETQATALQLAEASGHQADEIASASERIGEIAGSIEQVSRHATESADVAQRSVVIAARGAGVVRETIRGMDLIRDQIQDTAKRIKRLGESSQEIGSIVGLINDISEQTNVLALNAALQAASAGEAGRGFAVVADEVQRLAERTSSATRGIEALVQGIQADTHAAVGSMEQTTAEVVSGARLAEDAGTALAEIERVSNALNTLIHTISAAAQQQAMAASDITQTMGVIRQITGQTSQGAGQTADLIGRLAELAAELRRSVADFKLPA